MEPPCPGGPAAAASILPAFLSKCSTFYLCVFVPCKSGSSIGRHAQLCKMCFAGCQIQWMPFQTQSTTELSFYKVMVMHARGV